jgi:hypothetical protein
MDEILKRFLAGSLTQASILQSESDILSIIPAPSSDPPTIYLLLFEGLRYLRFGRSGIVEIASDFIPVEVRFPSDYLRTTDQHLYLKLATILDAVMLHIPNPDLFHPNYDPISGSLCLGADFRAGTPLNSIIHHIYQIITYQNFSTDERNALDPIACEYLRNHPEVLSQLKNKPLRRRQLQSKVVPK